jgi:hypothetical protein
MSNNEKSPDIPSISTLHKEKYVKEASKNEIFNIVLNKIVQKIVYTNRHTEQTYIIFEIPKILIGYPQYDMKSCILFVMNRLSTSGYMVEFMDPFYLYIDWGTNGTNTQRSKPIVKSSMNSISSKHKDNLRSQAKILLNKFPGASQIEFVYEDDIKGKRLKKTKKK